MEALYRGYRRCHLYGEIVIRRRVIHLGGERDQITIIQYRNAETPKTSTCGGHHDEIPSLHQHSITMVATRSKGPTGADETVPTSKKRTSRSEAAKGGAKKAKKEAKDGKLMVDGSGEVGLAQKEEKEGDDEEVVEAHDGDKAGDKVEDADGGEENKPKDDHSKEESGDKKDIPHEPTKSHHGESKQKVCIKDYTADQVE
jgi:hypothetical protein